MCIVIDTNVLSAVFSARDSCHPDYDPVLQWIVKGPGFAVYGGSTYMEELRKAKTYLGVLTELRKRGQARLIRNGAVDSEQLKVTALAPVDCDDTHLIAIFRASGCRLLCSNDRRGDVHIKDRRYYHRRQHVPRIYRNRRHTPLLNRRNIVTLRNMA